MASYQVWIAKPACREIKKLIKSAQVQVAATISKLSDNPLLPGTEKLQGRPSFFRIRSGDFRIIYSVRSEPRIVIILVVRDRKDAFKGLEELDAKLATALTEVAESILENATVGGSA